MERSSQLKNNRLTTLTSAINQVLASINVLLKEPGKDDIELIGNDPKNFSHYFCKTLWAILNDLTTLQHNRNSALRLKAVISEQHDSIDYLNTLATIAQDTPFSQLLEESIFEALTAGRLFEVDNHSRPDSPASQELIFKLQHADNICQKGVQTIADYIDLLNEYSSKHDGLSRLNPLLNQQLTPSSQFAFKGRTLSAATLEKLQNQAMKRDIFHTGRSFRYISGEFFKVNLDTIRGINEFYGYPETRDTFRRFFNDFANGNANHPLLITSLPGLGKTHITIAYALNHPNVTLILPEPADLATHLEKLILTLSRRKNNRFVLFFDDVDARNIDWYFFRTHVGGSFSLPENITIVIASNYDFPANISSRGRGLRFPTFDEIACQEMITDYLKSFGMKNPRPELVSVIAADFVEEFGQKVFEELSPRTLVRYLERYNKNQKKRKRTLDLSREELIARPDPQIFYEVNLKLMRSLYGDDVIQQMLKEKYDIYDDETLIK